MSQQYQKTPKQRLDLLLVERDLASSREKAKALIMAGAVLVNTEPHTKPGDLIPLDALITLKDTGTTYVSRGGDKLHKAILEQGIDLTGRICLDVGASTGGFTDCMLRHGAKRVYAIDVGYGQLAWSLRTDPRVISLERTNVRYLTTEQVPELAAFASIDVSFISLSLVLPVVEHFLAEGADLVCLVKPQFEAGKGNVSKKGVVHDPAIHLAVCEKIYDVAASLGLSPVGATYSPIKGPKGNIEYLLHVGKGAASVLPRISLSAVVAAAHEAL